MKDTKKRSHAWFQHHSARPCCGRCGLLRLRNAASEAAAKASCPGKDADS